MYLDVMQTKTDRVVWARWTRQVYNMCNNQLEVVSGQCTNDALRMLCPCFKWNLHGVQRCASYALTIRFLIEILAQPQFFSLLFATAFAFASWILRTFTFASYTVQMCTSNVTAPTFYSQFTSAELNKDFYYYFSFSREIRLTILK